MGFFKKVRKAAKKVGTATLDVATLGQREKIEDILTSDEALAISTGGLSILAQKQEEAAKKARQEERAQMSEQEKLRADQKELSGIEFERAKVQQADAKQTATRELFREREALRRTGVESRQQSQQLSAQLNTIGAQSQFASSQQNASQGSLQSNQADTSSQLSRLRDDNLSDAGRLESDFTANIDFLQSTFDLGGSINAASQNIADSQARQQRRAQDRADLLGGISAGASLGGLAGPGGAVAGAAIGALSTFL